MDTDKTMIEKIYSDLLNMKIELDIKSIPTPAYIQGKIIRCNDLQRKVEKYFIKIKRKTTMLEKNFRIKKVEIDVKKRDILTNNSKVKSIPTVKEREAFADGILEDAYQELLDLENDLNEHKALLDSIKLVERNLKGTNSDIKSLVKIMEQQISRLNVGTDGDPEVSDMVKGLDDLDGLEDEIDIDDVEDSSDYTTSEEDVVPPTPAEDDNDIEIDIEETEDISIDIDDSDESGEDVVVDNTSGISDETDAEPEITESEDDVTVDNTSEDVIEADEDDIIIPVDDDDDVISVDDDDPDGLSDLSAFLDGGDSLDELTESIEDGMDEGDGDEELIISEESAPAKGSITSDDIEVPDEESKDDIDVEDVLMDLDESEEDESESGVYDIDMDDIVVDGEEAEVTEEKTKSGAMDMDIDSIEIEEEGVSLDVPDDGDPYGLGEPTPGSLAEILSEPVKSLSEEEDESEDDIEIEIEEEVEEEEENQVEEESLVEDEEDEGIDIDALLDTL
jgi:hypothetical protein